MLLIFVAVEIAHKRVYGDRCPRKVFRIHRCSDIFGFRVVPVDMHVDMHIDMRVDMRIDMRVDMGVDMRVDMHIDVCVSMHECMHMSV